MNSIEQLMEDAESLGIDVRELLESAIDQYNSTRSDVYTLYRYIS